MFAGTFDALREAIRKQCRKPVAKAADGPRQYVPAPLFPRFDPEPRRNPGPDSRLTPAPQAPGSFLRGQHAGVALESVIAIAVLVTVCGSLMAITHAAYTDDRMGRAARAAAQAIALAPGGAATPAALESAACDAIRRELDLDAGFDCTDTWTVTVTTNLAASALASGAVANSDGGAGEMVLIEIGWKRAPWARAVGAMQGAGGHTAVGLARSEPAD